MLTPAIHLHDLLQILAHVRWQPAGLDKQVVHPHTQDGGGFFHILVARRILLFALDARPISWGDAEAVREFVQTNAIGNSFLSYAHARKGRAYGFRFRDWNDFEAEAQPLAATADPLIWQLTKQYASGPSAEQRVITKPEAGTVVVRVNGNPMSVDVDHLTGIVTFSSAPAAQPYADFVFDVPVRFDTDHLPVVAVAYHIQQVSSIALVEIRS